MNLHTRYWLELDHSMSVWHAGKAAAVAVMDGINEQFGGYAQPADVLPVGNRLFVVTVQDMSEPALRLPPRVNAV